MLLLLAALLALSWVVLNRQTSLREGLLLTALIFTFVLSLGTEILNLVLPLNVTTLSIFWLIFLDTVLGLNFSRLSYRRLDWRSAWCSVRREPLFWLNIFLVIGVGAIALTAAPNNGDVLTYHMSRVVHWRQQASIRHFPTHFLLQIFQNPGAEFISLHLTILGKVLGEGDHFVNLPQWLAWAGGGVVASLFAQRWALSLRFQLFAALVALSVPTALLQASTAKNDSLVTFWIFSALYYLPIAIRSRHLRDKLRFALALALAILTKGTAYVFLFPFILIYAFVGFRSQWRRTLSLAGISLLVLLLLNGGHFVRNYTTFGRILGPLNLVEGSENIYVNNSLSVAGMLTNLTRNLLQNLGSPFYEISDALSLGAYQLFKWLHLPLNDAQFSYASPRFMAPRGAESWGWGALDNGMRQSNFFHTIFYLGMCIAAFMLWRRLRVREVKTYGLAWLIALCLFCLLFKWEPFQNRLLLTWFTLGAPLLAFFVAKVLRTRTLYFVGTLFFLQALVPLLSSGIRPVFGAHSIFSEARRDQYYAMNPALATPYRQAAHTLAQRNCRHVGLILDRPFLFEYALWQSLRESLGPTFTLDHVQVRNSSRRLRPLDPEICAFLLVGIPEDFALRSLPYDKEFPLIEKAAGIAIYGAVR